MASSTLFRILLSLLFFGLASLCSNAAYPNNNQVNQTPTAYLPKILEEKFFPSLIPANKERHVEQKENRLHAQLMIKRT